jgi:hypothetical protein
MRLTKTSIKTDWNIPDSIENDRAIADLNQAVKLDPDEAIVVIHSLTTYGRRDNIIGV